MSEDNFPQGDLRGWADAPVSVPLDIASSTDISRGAVGLYVYLLTRPADAPMTTAAVAEELGASLPQVNTWWVELKAVGLIVSGGGQ